MKSEQERRHPLEIPADSAHTEYENNEEATLAEIVKAWRAKAGIPVSRASRVLGIPERTINGIEQGREFRYAKLLILALTALKGNEPSS